MATSLSSSQTLHTLLCKNLPVSLSSSFLSIPKPLAAPLSHCHRFLPLTHFTNNRLHYRRGLVVRAESENGAEALRPYDFDLFTIGAGSGGVRASRFAASFGASAAVCELPFSTISSDSAGGVGGTCVIRGCVPKKLLVYASKYAHEFEESHGFGWKYDTEPKHDWSTLIANKNAELHRLTGIYKNVLKNAGVTLIEGRGKIVDEHTVDVDGKLYSARHILVSVGGRPFIPDIPGSEYVIDSDAALELPSKPEKIAIVGGGYIAVEFAGIFNGLKSDVHVFIRQKKVLRGFDEEIRDFVAEQMSVRGIEFHTEELPQAILKSADGSLSLKTNKGTIEGFSHVMFATGRKPNTKDQDSGEMIGCAKMLDGLYYFAESSSGGKKVQSFSSISSPSVRETIMLWHLRLGHPSFFYLKFLFPKLFTGINCSSFSCESCIFAKNHRATYLPKPYRSSKPFYLIHSDVWGPSKVLTQNGKRWFVTFIDDHTRLTWVYLLTKKSDVKDIFTCFYNMIENQFHTRISILHTDNGTEYFNEHLDGFLTEKGISHQSTCVNTPQQNGIAERKNRHLLDVARAIMFSMHVPHYLWGDAVLTATYLINRMPSKILNFKTPLDRFKHHFPTVRLYSDLPLKVFGCVAYVHIPSLFRSKLDHRAVKCVFLGYASNKKGYRCFDPLNKKYFESMDVLFLEDKSFFTQNSLQGEISNSDSEEIFWVYPGNSSPLVPNMENSSLGGEILQSDPTDRDSELQVYTRRELDQENQDLTVNLLQNQSDASTNDPETSGNSLPIPSIVSVPSSDQNIAPNISDLDMSIVPSSVQNIAPNISDLDMSIVPSSVQNIAPIISDLDVPIAHRKGIRKCTKYPIANYLSYHRLSDDHRAFTSRITNLFIPRNIQEALDDSNWHLAVTDEMNALRENDTWDIVELPKDKKTVGCKWVFTIKCKADGSIERYKARLVAKGFTQTYGIDYQETFAPVAKINSIRVLLSVAVNSEWPLFQLDVKNAFLNGDLEDEVFMKVPPGFEVDFGINKVCRLKKSLYGLKQSPRAWFERFEKAVLSYGFSQSQADHTIFYRHTGNDKIVVLIVYVDDIILTGNDEAGRNSLKEKLANEFQIKDLGFLKYFLGMEFARSNEGVLVNQRKYIIDLLKETGLLGCRTAETPVEQNLKLQAAIKEEIKDKEKYQRLVGRLIYLSHTRPDISFAVSMVSQFMHAPGPSHFEAVYRILRYLKGTPGKGILFRKHDHLHVEVYTDADWAGSATDRRSTSGYCSFVGGNLVTWRSKKQSVVARSSAEAEFRALAHGICEGIWIKRLLEELNFNQVTPMRIYCDNKAAISIAHNPVLHDRTKHIEVDKHFIREKIDAGIICIPYLPTTEQVADVLTKGLPKLRFDKLIDKLAMEDIFKPA